MPVKGRLDRFLDKHFDKTDENVLRIREIVEGMDKKLTSLLKRQKEVFGDRWHNKRQRAVQTLDSKTGVLKIANKVDTSSK